MQIPSDYTQGHEKARAENSELASVYVAHTVVGDPEADAVVDELVSFPREKSARLIGLAMAGGDPAPEVPPALASFIEQVKNVPDWFDEAATLPGCRLYNRYSFEFMIALTCAGLIEGFTTGISKSFMYTGRLLDGNQGVRRLQRNNRHQLEIFLPGGLAPYADGWRLTLRIRLVHAQIRRLLGNQEDWDTSAWGTPVSAAHLALANAVFSARILGHVERLLGKRASSEERESFMQVWRYVGCLMGVREALLPRNEEEALELFKIGLLCEAPPGPESVAMANILINAVPVMMNASLAGGDNEATQKQLAHKIYRLSRSLIGDELADLLSYPKQGTRGLLPLFRLQRKLTLAWKKLFGLSGRRDRYNFEFITGLSHYQKQGGISYVLPDNAYSELSKDW